MIICKDVYKNYQMGKNEFQALRKINFTIEKGEFLALKGPSGSGKTTLLNLLGALDNPTQGEILFNNKNIASMNKKERYRFRAENLGFIFQHYNLIPELTVYENVEVPLLIAGAKVTKNQIEKIIDSVGLMSHSKHKPTELSGGQMQRVSIARALVKQPNLVLADEPTANLDSKTGKTIIELMHKLNKEYNITFIVASHDELVLEKMDRVINLKDGEIR